MLIYEREYEELRWDADCYNAVSGPWGDNTLPQGEYEVKVRHAVIKLTKPAYIDAMTGDAWFIPLNPKFSTPRRGFGIHPDGNVPGTEGCIGLVGWDASLFWTKWNSTPMNLRPKSLVVK